MTGNENVNADRQVLGNVPSEDVSLDVFLGMDQDQRAALPKSRLKKLLRLEDAQKKKQAKAEAASAIGVPKNGSADPNKQKEKRKKKAAALESIEYVDSTPKGEFKRMSETMLPGYQPSAVESSWYEWWEAKGFFSVDPAEALKHTPGNRFVMVLPPPNVTGSLHLGHTLMSAVEDCMTRWNRMCGKPSLWIPGIDHAGIATQVVVEKKLMRERKLTRHDLGRENFVDEVWKWKNEYGGTICNQLRRLGSSLDWKREEFTMSDRLSIAVREAFVRMYDMGLIYRDTRLVNWCCKLRTALSDIEVDYIDIDGKTLRSVPGYHEPVEFGVLTKFSYKVENSTEELVIATTRLETMLGDTAVAVHPEDARYKHLVGKKLVHPFLDRMIPIIADSELVDMDFGTGCVKVTPAHDPNDFQCGRRHNLEEINIFGEDGCVNSNGGKFSGLPRYIVRKKLELELEELGQLKGKEDNAMRLGICSRSGDVIEPLLKPQWWIHCKEMGQAAANAVRTGELEIVPETFKDTWFQWMDNIRDWCISRQLWWGHRIPAYRVVGVTPETWIVARDEAEALKKATELLQKSEAEFSLEQDEDVLDTWFSSGLFPFSVFGWPEKTMDMDAFYPNTVLETGHDILFFWVARMVMMGMTLTGTLPFKTVYLHAMVRDKHGQKMSKSLGNIIDPLEVISGCSLEYLLEKLESGNLEPAEFERATAAQKEEFPNGIPECGTDALRFGLIAYTQQARNMNLDIARVVGYRNFCNKLWNATRFALSNLGNDFKFEQRIFDEALVAGALHDRWIISRLNTAARMCNESLQKYCFSDAVSYAYNFWLYELCDVYLEAIKPVMNVPQTDIVSLEKQYSRHTLYFCLHSGFRLLHPFMPFVTEELFQRLPNRKLHEPHQESIMTAPYPVPISGSYGFKAAEADMELALQCVKALRSLRALYQLKPSARPDGVIRCRGDTARVTAESAAHCVMTLSGMGKVSVISSSDDIPAGLAVSLVDDNYDVGIYLTGLIDFSSELQKLEANAKEKRLQLKKTEEKMEVPDYERKVPEAIRERNQTLLEKLKSELDGIEELIAKFSSFLPSSQ